MLVRVAPTSPSVLPRCLRSQRVRLLALTHHHERDHPRGAMPIVLRGVFRRVMQAVSALTHSAAPLQVGRRRHGERSQPWLSHCRDQVRGLAADRMPAHEGSQELPRQSLLSLRPQPAHHAPCSRSMPVRFESHDAHGSPGSHAGSEMGAVIAVPRTHSSLR